MEESLTLPSPFWDLEQDHKHCRALLAGYTTGACSECEEKEFVIDQLVRRLDAHIAFKRAHVYDLYMKKLPESGPKYVAESDRADRAVEEALAILRHARGHISQHPEVDQAVRTLAETAMVAMSVEEELYFHALAKRLNQAELAELRDAFQRERGSIDTAPNEPGQAVGCGVGASATRGAEGVAGRVSSTISKVANRIGGSGSAGSPASSGGRAAASQTAPGERTAERT